MSGVKILFSPHILRQLSLVRTLMSGVKIIKRSPEKTWLWKNIQTLYWVIKVRRIICKAKDCIN